MADAAPWIVCQIGAREHYVLAEGLHRRGQLGALLTDRWADPGSLAASLPGALGRRLADRCNSALADAPVVHFTAASLTRELGARLPGAPGGWDKIMADNAWFEARSVAALEAGRLLEGPVKPVVFAYSYAALGILQAAKAAGCTTVLGQIDPAVTEEDIVAALPQSAGQFHRTPPGYWPRWRQECALADYIVVNSAWSRDGLLQAGIEASKLHIVPLAYTAPPPPVREPVPQTFTAHRPLKVLFLGSLIARKGIFELIGAALLLAGKAVEFHLVGPGGDALRGDLADLRQVIDHGPVPRGEVQHHFAAADVFVLPTHSDGFALTQLEALAHGLPVIASRRCGDVVRDGVDGLLLSDVSAEALASALRAYLANPGLLAAQGQAALAGLDRFSPGRVVADLVQIAG